MSSKKATARPARRPTKVSPVSRRKSSGRKATGAREARVARSIDKVLSKHAGTMAKLAR